MDVQCACTDCGKKLVMKIKRDSCILVIDKHSGHEKFYCSACLVKFFKTMK